jgi:O-acetyl-ADP-ribose deacetylase (regulator of RNase III)
VFLSSRSILPGDDFVTEIVGRLRQCSALLAVIGPEWRTYFKMENWDSDGRDIDWVHREIAEAFEAGVRVIPILVESAKMPAGDELPPDIAAVSRCQYLRLHHRNIPHDIARVVEEVSRLLPRAPSNVYGRRKAVQGDTRLFELVHPHPSPCRIGVITGSIRGVRNADIWVNSENTDMVMSRFTEYSTSAIIRYWGARRDEAGRVLKDLIGDELAARVGRRRPVAPCTAYVTGSGALAETNNVAHIVHVAAVQGEPGAGFRQVRDIGACVRAALVEAERLAAATPVATVLFPLLGTGVAAASVGPTVTALVAAATDHLVTSPGTALRAIYFLAHTEDELVALEQVFTTTPRLAAMSA